MSSCVGLFDNCGFIVVLWENKTGIICPMQNPLVTTLVIKCVWSATHIYVLSTFTTQSKFSNKQTQRAETCYFFQISETVGCCVLWDDVLYNNCDFRLKESSYCWNYIRNPSELAKRVVANSRNMQVFQLGTEANNDPTDLFFSDRLCPKLLQHVWKRLGGSSKGST